MYPMAFVCVSACDDLYFFFLLGYPLEIRLYVNRKKVNQEKNNRIINLVRIKVKVKIPANTSI